MTCCQHGSFNFILIDTTRHCCCQVCGTQWAVHLGGGVSRQDRTTDYIANESTGVEFLAMIDARRRQAAERRRARV